MTWRQMDQDQAGTTPRDSDRLKSAVRNGVNTSTCCFSRRVGIGSVADCLSSSWRTAATTSTVVSWLNWCSEQPSGAGVYCGGAARPSTRVHRQLCRPWTGENQRQQWSNWPSGSATHELVNRPPQLRWTRFLAAHFLSPERFTLLAPQVAIGAPFSCPGCVRSSSVGWSGRPSCTLKTTNTPFGMATFIVEPWVRWTTLTSCRARR